MLLLSGITFWHHSGVICSTINDRVCLLKCHVSPHIYTHFKIALLFSCLCNTIALNSISLSLGAMVSKIASIHCLALGVYLLLVLSLERKNGFCNSMTGEVLQSGRYMCTRSLVGFPLPAGRVVPPMLPMLGLLVPAMVLLYSPPLVPARVLLLHSCQLVPARVLLPSCWSLLSEVLLHMSSGPLPGSGRRARQHVEDVVMTGLVTMTQRKIQNLKWWLDQGNSR